MIHAPLKSMAKPRYQMKSSSTATKTDPVLPDTPQAITVVARGLMRDQAMQSMADVIRSRDTRTSKAPVCDVLRRACAGHPISLYCPKQKELLLFVHKLLD